MNTLTDDLIRPSSLPKLQECRCYVGKPAVSEAAARGTRLDAVIREQWLNPSPVELSPEDEAAVTWAFITLKHLSNGAAVETREEELQAVVPVDGVKAGTMDALCVYGGWLADFKTGQVRDYAGQMAAYALACMDAYFAEEWTTHLLFIDQKKVVSHNWSREEAEQFVTSIVNKPKEPTLCDYCTWCGAFDTCPLVRQSAEEVVSIQAEEKPTAYEKSVKRLLPEMEVLKHDYKAAHAFLTKLGIVNEWAELLKKSIREQLTDDEKNDYFNRIVVAGRKVVNPLALGKYWEEFGWQRLLGMCSQIPLSAVEKEWKEVMGEKPFPADLVVSSNSSVQLRLKKIKTPNK